MYSIYKPAHGLAFDAGLINRKNFESAIKRAYFCMALSRDFTVLCRR